MTTRVLLADDRQVRLAELLRGEDGIEVVAEASSGAEAITLAARLRPDVVVMDLRAPDLDGAAVTARIAADLTGTRVVVLATHETDDRLVRAVEAGAAGYVVSETPRHALAAAICGAPCTPLAVPTAGTRRVGVQPLTAREAEIVRLVDAGLTNAEIGRRLGIGEATVKSHLVKAFTKLGVGDRHAAVTAARALGHLPP